MDAVNTGAVTRWMIRRDMPRVMEIERGSFGDPWTEEEFKKCLIQRNCIGMVAERDGQVVGFMIYELLKTQLHVLNFAVAPSSRRHGVGTDMVRKLVSKLSQQRRNEIVLEVSDYNLDAQLFFQRHGFWAVKVLREHYDGVDAYVMSYLCGQDAQ